MSAGEDVARLRRAGSGTLPDGRLVTWSVAEGARGRRWRWTLASATRLVHVGLIELDSKRRFVRLELETGEGMLTLHPDPDRRSVHGNIVRADGAEPVALGWSDDALAIHGDPFGSAVLGSRGRGWAVGPDLRLRRDDRADDLSALGLDERGVPSLRDPREWPLETGS